MLDHVPAQGQDLEAFEPLKVGDVANHVGREGELFAVEQQVEGPVHLLDRGVHTDQFYFSVSSRETGNVEIAHA